MSYTMSIINSMMHGMIQAKLARGYTKMNNGLFEDCLGQVHTVAFQQRSEAFNGGMVNFIELKLVPVAIVGKL